MLERSQISQETLLTKWEIFGYGLGGFSSTLPYQFKTQFGMSFMSDVAGIPIGIVGMLSMIMSIWDAINDPIIGYITDNTNSRRWGRYRPHMFFGAIGLAVTVLLMFWLPPLSSGRRIAYYSLVLALFSVFYTQFTVPWQALNSVMSTNSHQRNQLLVSRQLIGALATSMVGLLTAILVPRFSNIAKGWFSAACIISLLLVASALCAVSAARNSDRYRKKSFTSNNSSFQLQLKQVARNKAVMFASLMLGTVNFAITINAGISMYYLRCVVGNVKILAIISVIQILVSLLLVPFLPRLLRKFGKLPMLRATVILQAVAALALMVLRQNATIPQIIIISLLSTTGLTFANICCFALIPDCTDYAELNFGDAQAGFINAYCTFIRKLCGSFSALFISGLLAHVGYDVNKPILQSWIDMLVNIKVFVPFVTLAAVLILSRLYPITTQYAQQMGQNLKARRNTNYSQQG